MEAVEAMETTDRLFDRLCGIIETLDTQANTPDAQSYPIESLCTMADEMIRESNHILEILKNKVSANDKYGQEYIQKIESTITAMHEWKNVLCVVRDGLPEDSIPVDYSSCNEKDAMSD